MTKCIVKQSSIVTHRGINYTGGQEIDLAPSIIERIKKDVDVVEEKKAEVVKEKKIKLHGGPSAMKDTD